MKNFLQRYGWSLRAPVAEDGSSRRYFRVSKNGRSAILMEVFADTPGHRIFDFIRIAGWLREIGLKAPEIYETDEAGGFLLLEDFGDISFKDALENGEDARELYGLAADVLNHLQAQNCPLDLPDYYQNHVHANHRFVMEWYAPLVREEQSSPDLVSEYLSVWQEIEKALPPEKPGFVHVDFHVQNLMFLPGEKGLKRCGLLDFQGAMRGPLSYDWGNLLEDVRVDVPGDIRTKFLSERDEDFRRRYRILTTQFHCRVIGQFIKLAAEQGKSDYLSYIPRTAGYIRSALEDPLLKPLKHFFLAEKIDFNPSKPLNFAQIHRYIPAKAS